MYAESFGKSELVLDLPEGATAGAALAALARDPAAARLPARPLLAVNQRYAPADQALRDGDEVAVIPPVAGG